jgi:diguanylate cyclase (GGDEF)-like protein
MSRSKLTRNIVLIVFLCFVLSTFVSLWSLHVMASKNMQALSKTLAARIYDSIIGQLSEPVIVSRTMANDSFLIDLLETEESRNPLETGKTMQTYLSNLCEGLKYEAAFVVSSATRRYYTSQGLGKQINPEQDSRDRWYAEFLEQNEEFRLDVDRDEFGADAWTVFVDTRIKNNEGKLLGICGVGVRMTGAQRLFHELERDFNVRICLTDPDGLVMVSTDESAIETERLQNVSLSRDEDYLFQSTGNHAYVVTKYIDQLDWYLAVHTDGRNESGQFLNVILLNIGLCLIVMVILVIAIRIILDRTKALTHASFRDQTTQLLNRRAFEEDKEKLADHPLDEDFAYVTADLNGLKWANDHLGHTAGDELIRGAADCLRDVFGAYGQVYRIGGDEFAAILKLSPQALEASMKELEAKTAAWQGDKVKELSISCGCVTSREFPSENLQELIRISDERMYAAKDEYYRRTGKDRRT